MRREIHYSWEYNLEASPEKLWSFVADTNRFNRDTGVPSVDVATGKQARLQNARRRLRLSIYGMAVEWEEQPFEWVRPVRFGVVRTYTKGPMAQLRALAELTPLPDGGTKLKYSVWARPKSLLGAIVIPLQLKLVSAGRFARAFREYDRIASVETLAPATESRVELSAPALARSRITREKLLSEGAESSIVDRLIDFAQSSDELSVTHMRPYELADDWKVSRRAVLETCLRATRAGLLDLQWDLLCPLCRGVKETGGSLRDISSQIHCEICRIDATVNFDRYVEVTFRPNALLRRLETQEFCMGSPQRTPHVVAQQLLPAHTNRTLTMPLEPGRYRLRALELAGGQDVTVSHDANESATIRISPAGWPNEVLRLSTEALLYIENTTEAEQLFILERLAWSDQAVTAAEVTALQVFRDLFSSEALRSGQQISVGTMTVLFTDLRNSTRMYREIGDATAFGRVMNHFDVLKQAIAAEEGALVKTIGDAVMAVFREPENALRAMLKAQQILAAPPDGSPALILKAGLHTGPCIAVTLNDRLDYFGSTVNMAARLEGLSTGNDVIISRPVYEDPQVREMIDSPEGELAAERFEIPLKGFDQEQFELWRIGRR
ncbi:MAG: adenylate/guanylate cyclase [Acidobacteria bacterium]|nr:adenylate/guanylate cyclase [Acidobacteriota bacterium]